MLGQDSGGRNWTWRHALVSARLSAQGLTPKKVAKKIEMFCCEMLEMFCFVGRSLIVGNVCEMMLELSREMKLELSREMMLEMFCFTFLLLEMFCFTFFVVWKCLCL